MEKAVASTTYTVDGVDYKREVFTSFADQLVIIRLTASQPGKLTFTTALTCPQDVDITTSGKDAMTMEGVTKGNEFVEGAVRFRTDLKLNVQGGKTSANDSTLIVTRANSATIYLAISFLVPGKNTKYLKFCRNEIKKVKILVVLAAHHKGKCHLNFLQIKKKRIQETG